MKWLQVSLKKLSWRLDLIDFDLKFVILWESLVNVKLEEYMSSTFCEQKLKILNRSYWTLFFLQLNSHLVNIIRQRTKFKDTKFILLEQLSLLKPKWNCGRNLSNKRHEIGLSIALILMLIPNLKRNIDALL